MRIKKLIQKVISHSLARDSAVVMAGMMVANIGSYAFHLLMGRFLGPQKYGELSSLISLMYMFAVPTIVLQTILVRQFSIYKAHSSFGQYHQLFRKSTLYAAKILVLGFLCLLPFVFVIKWFLHLTSARSVLWTYGQFLFTSMAIVSSSAVQGLQLFLWFGVLSGVGIVMKVLFSVPASFYGVETVVFAGMVSYALAYGVTLLPLRRLFLHRPESTNIQLRTVTRFAIPTLGAILGITALYSVDILLVRHYFSPEQSGIYAAVALLGKIIFYASSALASVLFPIVAERSEKKQSVRQHIVFGCIVVGGTSLCITLLYALFPSFVVLNLFGSSYALTIPYLGLFGIFMTCFSIAYLFTQLLLAMNKTGVAFFLLGSAVIQTVGIIALHQTIFHVIWVNIFVSFLLALALIGYYTHLTQVCSFLKRKS